MINLEEHKWTIVHCPTEELIMKVEDQIVELGGRRLWGNDAKAYMKQKGEPNGMSFSLEDVSRHCNCYCNVSWYRNQGKYNIITAGEFLRLCGKEAIVDNYQIF